MPLDFGPIKLADGRTTTPAAALATLAAAKKYNAYSTPEGAQWFRDNILNPWKANEYRTLLFRSGHVSVDTLRQKITGAARYIIDHEQDAKFTEFWSTIKVRKTPEGLVLSVVPKEVEILELEQSLDNVDYVQLRREVQAWVSTEPTVGEQFERRGLNLSVGELYYYQELLDNLRPFYGGSVGTTYIHFKRITAPAL